MGDTLKLVNQLQTSEERNFNFDSAQDKYNATENPGQTYAGTLNINGIAENGTRSEINLNSNSGFELANNSTLNLNNTKLTGNETLITVSNPDAVVNLKNAHIDGNILSSTEYGMNISGGKMIQQSSTAVQATQMQLSQIPILNLTQIHLKMLL